VVFSRAYGGPRRPHREARARHLARASRDHDHHRDGRVRLALRGQRAPVDAVPLIASSAIAWGGGFLQAFAVAAHALRRDRKEGILHLFASRGAALEGYVVARVGGLAAMLALVVAGGTLFTGVVAVLAAARVHTVARTAQATGAALAFGLAFAVVVAPVAFAALGARSRVGGYLFLLGVVVFPEILAGALSEVLPPEVTDVLSIPSALSALRAGIAPGTSDGFRVVRALVALAIFVALALALVRREAIVAERAELEA
jgi:hypothetical protein